MSKRPGETTIKTSIRIRPCSQQERETYPGPCPVQAAPGEVRLFQRPLIPSSGRNSPSSVLRSPRPGTPTSPHVTPRGPSSPSMVWRQQAAAQAQHFSSDYQSYPFANVFGAEDGNEEVYNGSGCRDVVAAVLGGCNGTIFVYGQTGAGKTFTMDAVTDLVLQQLYAAGADDSSSEVAISVCAVELYNEVLRCLLSGRENLQLRWASGAGSVSGIVLEGAEERPCGSIEEAAALVTMAKASRAVGETRANARSSRSHLIVRIKVEVLQLSTLAGGPPSPSTTRRISLSTAAAKGGRPPPATVSFSMLNLVDLAGSERIDKTGSSDTPLRLREALNINKSLLCLGNVVTALAERAEGKRASHIPYRDSKLTRLLEDSLGGNATTALIACITPLPDWNLEQSRNTLEFAARAARVVCKPQRNVLNLAPSGPASGEAANIIASLQAEVAALKKQLAEQQQQQGPLSPQPQLHALAVQPVSSSNTLWEGCGIFNSRGSALAGVCESTAEAGGRQGSEGSPSPNSASCPSSPTGRQSPFLRARNGGWTTRLRMSLGGGSTGSQEATPGSPTSPDNRGSIFKTAHSFPSRIPTPKQSLFGSLTSPRASKKPVETAASDKPQSEVPAAAIQTHPAGPTASESGSNSSAGALPVSAHTTSIISRASGAHKSLLWKLLQQPHPHERAQPLALDRISTGGGSAGSGHSSHGGPTSTQSLKSTGLLITSSGNAATAAAAVAANAVGTVLARWATFTGGRSSPTYSTTLATQQPERAETHDGGITCHPLQLSQQASAVFTGRSSIASRRLTTDGATGLASGALLGAAGGQQALESASSNPVALESRMAAAEAAMALRDHIIKQLVLALQQKKAELRSLKEQLAAVLKQLESSEGEEETNKAKLRELAEGIQMLAAARQEEFEKWKGHLVGLEAALQSAQKEATNYRDESQTLVQQLAELQARYDSLQTEQGNKLATVAAAQAALGRCNSFGTQQQEQLSACLSRLQQIETALQQLVKTSPQSLTSSRQCTPRSRMHSPGPLSQLEEAPWQPQQQSQQQHSQPQPQQPLEQPPAGGLLALQPLLPLGGLLPRESSKGDVTSHCIQTVTTRVYEAGVSPRQALTPRPAITPDADSLARAAEEAATAAKLSHIEFVLAELQELLPLVKAAAEAAVQASSARSPSVSVSGHAGAAAAATMQTLTALQRLGMLQTGSIADNTEGKQQDQAVQTKEAKASLAGVGLLSVGGKCHKCDSLKPLMVIMQKLKDEVVVLKAAVRNRDAEIAAAEDAAAGLKADLLESKQQVGALRERIDELSEDLEVARSAAAAAAEAISCSAATTGPAGSNGPQSPGGAQSPGRELSHREVSCKQVPLMGEDTPLEALHAQILQSWQALAMPFAYRCAFVLGASATSSEGSSEGSSHMDNNSASSSSVVTAAAADTADVRQAPWDDRVQCQAHIALLACLHQYQEDEPAAAQQQREVLEQEAHVVDAGLAHLPTQRLSSLLERWGVEAAADPATQRAALLSKLWVPGGAATAEALAADSAAACQLAYQAAPPAALAQVSLRCNASVIAAASNALAEAAS